MNTAIENLRESLRGALAQATFDIGRGKIIEFQRLREMHERTKWDDGELRRLKSAIVCVPGPRKSEIADSLRGLLAEYIDPGSDCVGHSFPMGGDRGSYQKGWPTGLNTHSKVSSVDQLGLELLKGAAVLGVNCVTDLLANWTNGDPVAYRTCRLVRLTIDQPITPLDGVRIIPLPLSTDRLQAGLPSWGRIRRSDYLGHAVVSVDTNATPALFRPDSGNLGDMVSGELPRGFTFDSLWDALALQCNTHVEVGHGWTDYGHLSAIARDSAIRAPRALSYPDGYRGVTIDLSVTKIEVDERATQTLSEDGIRNLLTALRGAGAPTRMAVARWKNSMDRGSGDAFIDLRIALEALFLPDGSDHQLSFTVAARGAWWLGKDAVDRRRIWKTLRDAYSAASSAVHKGKAKKKGYDASRLAALLTDAQSLCRDGILRVLHEGSVKDWTGVILDAPST